MAAGKKKINISIRKKMMWTGLMPSNIQGNQINHLLNVIKREKIRNRNNIRVIFT